MAQDAEKKPQQNKKKWGFLGTLLRLFLFFVLLCGIGTGLVYWKRKPVTAWCLQQYAQKLADVMVAQYQIDEDEDYRKEVKGREGDIKFSSEEFKTNMLAKKRELAVKIFTDLVDTYKASSATEWYSSFRDLNEKSKQTLQDQRVTPQEFQDFLQSVEKVAEGYKQNTPAASDNDKQESPK